MSRVLIVHKSGEVFLEFHSASIRTEVIKSQVEEFLENFLTVNGIMMAKDDFYFCLDNNYKIDVHDKLLKKEEIWT